MKKEKKMNERELFEKFAKRKKYTLIGATSDGVFHYLNQKTHIAWEAWQASAQREGYKLVPVDTLEVALDWFDHVEHDWTGAADLTNDYKHKSIIEKAMI